MTFTKEEIETALTWHRRTDNNYIEARNLLFHAGDRVNFYGSYESICEHILRITLEEIQKTVDGK